MIMQMLKRISPWLREKQHELNRESVRTRVVIVQHRHASRELQEEIESNNFAKYLIYEKGE